MTYPLTPVPFPLCHLNESIMKTDKSILTKLLESNVENHGGPRDVDVFLIDDFFFVARNQPNSANIWANFEADNKINY